MTSDDIKQRLADMCPAPRIGWDAAEAARYLDALRTIAAEGDNAAQSVAEAVGVSVAVTPSGVCVSRGRCDCVPRIVAAKERTE